MSEEAQPTTPPPGEIPAEFLEREGITGKQAEIILRRNGWTAEPLPIDKLKAGLHDALHGRI